MLLSSLKLQTVSLMLLRPEPTQRQWSCTVCGDILSILMSLQKRPVPAIFHLRFHEFGRHVHRKAALLVPESAFVMVVPDFDQQASAEPAGCTPGCSLEGSKLLSSTLPKYLVWCDASVLHRVVNPLHWLK